jgi:hypothetical protein
MKRLASFSRKLEWCRGKDSIPVIAYIMAMKILNPNKWWLIRGNHETREVNGNIEHYQVRCLRFSCLSWTTVTIIIP